MILYSAIAALVLALTHLFAEKLDFASIPRSKWLSFAGGISVAYIFMHLLPELAEGQELLKERGISFLKHHVYLISLFGLTLFYGLERAAKESSHSTRGKNRKKDHDDDNIELFWLHISTFGLYNAIIGYLLVHRQDGSGISLLWFTLAMAFHFVVNDYALVEHYKRAYTGRGRWIITLAVLGAWLVGVLAEIPEVWIKVLIAFIAGGTILNILKEELPEERKSNFWAFGIGILIYTVLLLVV